METTQLKSDVRVLCEDDVGGASTQSRDVYCRASQGEHRLCEDASGRLGVAATRAAASFAGPLEESKTAGERISGPLEVDDTAIHL